MSIYKALAAIDYDGMELTSTVDIHIPWVTRTGWLLHLIPTARSWGATRRVLPRPITLIT
eukprot:scaffold846_cov168-Amphora_coffeaeformis.AAC.2